jgi:hypothetical protein
LLGNSVGQWQDEHGDLPDRFPPERPATFSAHLLHTGRARTSQKSKLNGPGCLMPDQPHALLDIPKENSTSPKMAFWVSVLAGAVDHQPLCLLDERIQRHLAAHKAGK